MTFRIKHVNMKNRHSVIPVMVLCLFALGLLSSLAAPRKPVRKTDQRVYLNHADELKYDVYGANPDAQIAKGRVSFLHRGATLTCDSAYFYQSSNSVRAFGHVRFRQGDTLSLTCDRAWYDGQSELLEARSNVVLKHRTRTLYTDSLNYDRLYSNAYYFKGGRMIDGKSKLSSDWGEYHLDSKQAVFYYDVQLHTPKNRVSTDTLYYDTRTSLAHVVGQYTPDKGKGKPGPSIIVNQNSTITTTDAFFNTADDHAQLYGRSTVVDKEKTITGDTLLYNSKTGENHGFGNVVYVDSKNKNMLTCGEVVYNEQTGKGYATRHARVMDYSQKDTLYMHADTLRIETFNINTDSVYRKVHCYNKVRVYRTDVQAVCDSMVVNSKDSCMTMYRDPIVWNGNRQLLGEVIKVYMNDSTIREAHVLGQALSIEQMPDTIHFNQVSSTNMFAYFIDGQVRRSDAVRNVRTIFFPVDDKDSTLIGLNYCETDTMKMYILPNRKLQRIWMPKAQGTLYPMTQIPPGKMKLDVFAWFDYIRPLDKDDIFEWRGKRGGTELKRLERHAAPLQKLSDGEKQATAPGSVRDGAA